MAGTAQTAPHVCAVCLCSCLCLCVFMCGYVYLLFCVCVLLCMSVLVLCMCVCVCVCVGLRWSNVAQRIVSTTAAATGSAWLVSESVTWVTMDMLASRVSVL